MPEKFIPKVPADWHNEYAEKDENGKHVTEGFVAGLGDGAELVGQYTVVDGRTVLTVSNHGAHGSADWAIRVMAPKPMLECLDAACEAACMLGLAKR